MIALQRFPYDALRIIRFQSISRVSKHVIHFTENLCLFYVLVGHLWLIWFPNSLNMEIHHTQSPERVYLVEKCAVHTRKP